MNGVYNMSKKIDKTIQPELNDKLEIEGVNADGYGIMPKIVMQDKRLTIEAKAIYAYIVSFAGAGNTAFPSAKKILNDLQISENRFYKHRKILIEYNYITVSPVFNDKRQIIRNIYKLISNPITRKLDTTLQNEGGGTLQNEGGGTLQNEGHIINNSKNNNFKIKDTIKTDTDREKIRQQLLLETYHETQEQTYLNEQSLKWLSVYSDTIEEVWHKHGIINRAKKKAEKEQAFDLLVGTPEQEEIEKCIRRVTHKIKTDGRIEKPDNFMFTSFYKLFVQLITHIKAQRGLLSNTPEVTLHNWVEE